MLAPLIFAGVLAIVGWHLGRSKQSFVKTGSGNWSPTNRDLVRPKYLGLLARVVASGGQPSFGLLDLAWREAKTLGDKQSLVIIEQLATCPYPFSDPGVTPQEQQQQLAPAGPVDPGDLPPVWNVDERTGEETEEGGQTAEDWGEMVNAPKAAEVPVAASPAQVPDVDPQAWVSFCNALRTRDVGYGNDNYLGQFEHNKRRLRQLGIPEGTLGNADAQYQALCKDIGDYRLRCQALIDEYAGTEVAIGPDTCKVTPSGVLGLLKAAGPQGARGWLSNPGDRQAFPTTTEVFLRCNGCF